MARLKKVECVEIVGFGKLPIKEGGFTASGKKREHKASTCNAADGGYTDTNEPAKLKLTVLSHGYIDAQTLNKLEGQVTVTLAGGHMHIMPKAWTEEPAEEKDGEFEITYVANVSQRIT